MSIRRASNQPFGHPGSDWPSAIQADFAANNCNPGVGTRLLSANDRVRVWEIRLKPGGRIGFHRHVLDYFWTAATPGKALSHQGDGTTVEATYVVGETKHHVYGPGEYKVHDLENIGPTELLFTTVEFLDSANPPLPLASASAGGTT
jgi:beta-alanine degradation protein BauB